MKRINSQKGQALILIALAIVGLVGFTALTIDGGRVLSDRRNAQNAADTAVLSAALTKIKTPGTESAKNAAAITAAIARSTSNGYTTGANGATVEVNFCNESGVTCQGLPTGATSSEYMRVKITSIVSTTFARVVGRATVKNVVEAIARVQGTSSSSSGSFGNGSAMVATQSGNVDNCLYLNGNAVVNVHNSGIFINCQGTKSIYMNSGATVNMDAQGQTAGCNGGNLPYTLAPTTCSVAPQTFDASTFASAPTADPKPTCSGNGKVNGVTSGSPPNPTVNSGTTTLSPGNFSGFTLNSGTLQFDAGTYCISGNMNINGGTLTGPSGKVQLVLQDQALNLNSGVMFDFANLEFYGNNASLTLNSGAILRADRLRFFSTGSTTSAVFTVNAGNAEVTSGDAYFYLKSGNIIWNADNKINLHAPLAPDTYAGLLVYKPWGNSSTINLNGGSNIHLTGTFLVPSTPINFNSGVTFELHSQVIASTYNVNTNGGGSIDIYYQADENYGSPVASSPTIELIK